MQAERLNCRCYGNCSEYFIAPLLTSLKRFGHSVVALAVRVPQVATRLSVANRDLAGIHYDELAPKLEEPERWR